jgi:enoyl-CoA hydratase/carnithine racemase
MNQAVNPESSAGVVLATRRGRALWISINREEKRNAINPEVIAGIHEAVLKAGADSSLRAIVLTGAGRKAFCAGADLSRGAGVFADELAEPTTDFGRLARAFRALGLPTIARVNGDCVAGGMGLMSLCDLAVVAEHARFGLPEAKVGVFPMQVLVYLRRMMHPRHVNELCLTGSLITAARAMEMGIANRLVPHEHLDASVDALVEQISGMSPGALKRGKSVIAAMEAMGHAEALAFAEAQIAIAARTEDAHEGLAAYNEKRMPRWAVDGDAV